MKRRETSGNSSRLHSATLENTWAWETGDGLLSFRRLVLWLVSQIQRKSLGFLKNKPTMSGASMMSRSKPRQNFWKTMSQLEMKRRPSWLSLNRNKEIFPFIMINRLRPLQVLSIWKDNYPLHKKLLCKENKHAKMQLEKRSSCNKKLFLSRRTLTMLMFLFRRLSRRRPTKTIQFAAWMMKLLIRMRLSINSTRKRSMWVKMQQSLWKTSKLQKTRSIIWTKSRTNLNPHWMS